MTAALSGRSSTLLVLETDKDGRLLWWNAACEEASGRALASVRGRHLWDALPFRGDVEEIKAAFASVRDGAPPPRAASLCIARGTERRHLAWSWMPVHDAGDELERVVGVAVELGATAAGEPPAACTVCSSEEELQRFLSEAGQLLAASLDYERTLASVARLSVESLADYCIISVLQDGALHRIKAAAADPRRAALAERLRAYPRGHRRPPFAKEALRTKAPQLVPSLSPAYLDSIAEDAEEARLLREIAPQSYIAAPMIARERAIGVIVFIAAERGRRYQAAELRVAVELASRAALAVDNASLYREAQLQLRAREQILGIVAHDLRSPLNTVGLSVQVISRGLERAAPREALQRPLEAIGRSVTRMDRLIEDLLDLSRIDSGRLSIEARPAEAAALVREALDAARPLAVQAELVAEEPTPLPQVLADRGRVLQVFSNLIGNAIKFTPPGGTITVGARQEGAAVRFSVSDTGVGIPPAQLSHVFDRFWQGADGDRRGAGLGLAIVRGIVEAHGGRIEARSEPGEGSEFAFTLPAVA